MKPTRRTLLSAAGTGLLAALAGCGGGGIGGGGGDGGSGPSTPVEGGDNKGLVTPTPTPDPVPNLAFDGLEFGERDGALLVTVTVVNDGDDTGSGSFEVVIRVGDQEFTRTRSVSLGVDEEQTFDFVFEETTRSELQQDGSIDVNWQS